MPAPVPTYPTDCPICGAQLQPVALDLNTAPFLCYDDGVGYWACELSNDARGAYSVRLKSWTDPAIAASLVTQRQSELVDAHTRNTSLREDQFALAPLALLEQLDANGNLEPNFHALLHTEILNRGGH